jgi:carboxyl-terminal processing protease
MKRFIKRCMPVKKLRVILITGASIIVLFFTFSFVDSDFKILKNLDIYYTLFRELNLYYVDNTDPEKLVKTSIDAMLESLDPYTVFIPESEQDDYKFLTTGEYGGIGALIRKTNDYYTISEIWENSPAFKAGIKVGDVLLEINGLPVSRKTNSEINELLKGEPKTNIDLTLEHPGQFKTFKAMLTRERITISNVPYYGMVTENIGYIKQTNFTTDAHVEVRNAMVKLKALGAKSIILDLRGNPGGLLVEAIGITNLFVEKGQEIVRTKGKVKQWDNTYKTKSQPLDADIQLAVLVNRSSASAAEIVAGSLQDLDRAVIIGNRTFGKGLVQTTRPLSYNTQLKVTTAKYYTPSGRCIQALDYTHREPDGSVGYIPDSLITEFSTKVGRKVYDGGGIMPDIVIKNDPLSKITINLYARSYIFNFATTYCLNHDSIASNFKLTDADYDQFIAYLGDKKFDYQTETEEAFIKLSNMAAQEKYLEEAKDEFKALAKKLTHDKLKDLTKYKEEISELLKEEIVSRYYFQRGRIETSLSTDTHVIKAIEVLSSKQLYTGILDGTFRTIFADTRKGKNQND